MKFILKSMFACISFSLIAMTKEEPPRALFARDLDSKPKILCKCDSTITLFDQEQSIIELLLNAQSDPDHVYTILPVYYYIKKEFKPMGTAKNLTSIDIDQICSNKFLFLYHHNLPLHSPDADALILGTNDPNIIAEFEHFQLRQNELAAISLINDIYDKTKPPPIQLLGRFSFFEPNKE